MCMISVTNKDKPPNWDMLPGKMLSDGSIPISLYLQGYNGRTFTVGPISIVETACGEPCKLLMGVKQPEPFLDTNSLKFFNLFTLHQ